MWVTLYTDFSGKGGYGIWIKSDKGRIVKKGTTHISDSTAGELIAILQGIITIKESWNNVKGINVYSDSLAAIRIAKFKAKPPKRKDLLELQNLIKHHLGDSFIKCNWVKGHQNPYKNTQAYLNHQCDLLSKKL